MINASIFNIVTQVWGRGDLTQNLGPFIHQGLGTVRIDSLLDLVQQEGDNNICLIN
jgi:hypothetical protein